MRLGFLSLCVVQVPTDLCSTYSGMSDKFLDHGLNLSFISLIRWQAALANNALAVELHEATLPVAASGKDIHRRTPVPTPHQFHTLTSQFL